MWACHPAFIIEPGYAIEQVVAGSGFHIASSVAFGPDERLSVASVSEESIFALDVATSAITVEVGPFAATRMAPPKPPMVT